MITHTAVLLFRWPLLLAADTGASSQLTSFVLLFAPLFAIWYFLVIRPQQTQRRKTQEMLSNLKTGDKVVTSGGIYGTISGFRDGVVQLQVTPQVKIDVSRTAITSLQPTPEDAESKSKK